MPQRANVNQNVEGGSAKHAAKVRAGKLGGVVGGPARARKLSRQRRHDIAQEAAIRRWSSNRSKQIKEAKAAKKRGKA